MSRMVSLLTASGTSVSGGHLYNRRMLAAAPRYGTEMQVVQVDEVSDLTNVAGQVVIDSLVAASIAGKLPHEPGPLAALVHQVPGGADGSMRARRARHAADLHLYGMCRLVIAASTYLEDELVQAGVPRSHIEVVPPGCDPAPVADSPPVDLREGRKLALLNVANWLPNKGILQLLDVMDSLPTDDVVLHLVGARDVDPRYTRRIERRLWDVGDRVVVHGEAPPEAVAGLYAAADALVIASQSEGYATVVAEALRAGLPVLGWGVGNIPNLMSDGDEGRLFQPGDTDGLAGAIVNLVRDDDMRARFASRAAATGRQLPTWEETGDRFFEVLGRIGR